MIFITRVYLIGSPAEPRECTLSEYYGTSSFEDMKRSYHWLMEELVEERMDIYEGRTLLSCEGEDMKEVIPSGTIASSVAKDFRTLDAAYLIPDPFTYSDFERLLYEFWRTYDCHLFALEHYPVAMIEALRSLAEGENGLIIDNALAAQELELERMRARRTYERLIAVIKASEQNLPLHASLRCLQRGSTDIRNASAIISDISQCLPRKLGQPETSLLK